MRFTLLSLGCKVNQSEISRMEAALRAEGHEIVTLEESPDYCIVNTCTVTSKADYQSRQIIRKAGKFGARIIATGCFTELNHSEVSGMDGVHQVVSNSDKHQSISQFVHNIRDITLSYPSMRARYTLKVQDGCNNACSYCLIPRARGRSRSVPMDEVVREARMATESGYREIVLTGVHLGQYGKDCGQNLSSLIEQLLVTCSGVRLRLTSLEVSEIDDRLLDILTHDRICRHLHIPLQGGDDAILRLMNRKYNILEFERAVIKVIGKTGEIGLGTDVIAGFPGEDDLMFKNSLNYLTKLPFTYIHVFPFSARAGTIAHAMHDSVDASERRIRTDALRRLSDAKKHAFMLAQIGKTLDVLVETHMEEGLVSGTSSNYLKVQVSGESFDRGGIVRARIHGIRNGMLSADIVKSR